MVTYEEIIDLKKQAEDLRIKGNRDECLKLKQEAKNKEEALVLQNHNNRLAQVKREFPIGKYIEELKVSVKDIKDGCGTQRGWINIYLNSYEKPIPINELYEKIRKNKENKEARLFIAKINQTYKGKIKIGDNNLDTIDYILNYMEMDKIWNLQKYEEESMDWGGEYFKDDKQNFINDGYTNEQAEEKAQELEDKYRDDEFNKYKSKVIESISYLLSFANLKYVEMKQNIYFEPLTSWPNTADKMSGIISGYGTFYYKNGKELKDIGPYKTYSEAVIKHLHWLKYAPEVYGDKNYDFMMR